MEAIRWLCLTVALCILGLMTSCSANVLNACRLQCRSEEEQKAACIRQRNCDSLLPDLTAFVDCLEPCTNLGDNCFQRCAFKTDRITALCRSQCFSGEANNNPSYISARAVLGDVPSSGELCFRACYDNLLNAAMNRLYTKRPTLSN